MCLEWHVSLGPYWRPPGGDIGSLASLSGSAPFVHLYLQSEVSKTIPMPRIALKREAGQAKKKKKKRRIIYVAPQYNHSWIVL